MRRKTEATWIEDEQRWYLKVQSNGVRKTFTSSIKGRKGKLDAEYQADDWLARPSTNVDIKVERLYEDFLTEMETLDLQTSQYRSLGKTRVIPALGKKCIGDVTEQDLQNILNQGYIDGQSKKSLNNLRGCLTSFIKYCRKRGCTELRPMDLVIHKKAPVYEKKSLQPEEIRKVFSSDETLWRGKPAFDRYIYAYRFAIATGLRPGELVGLKWEDISKDGIVSIRRAINAQREETPGKNKNAQRQFKMIPQAEEAIRAQAQMLVAEKNNSPYVFPYTDESFTTQNNFFKCWKRYAEHNGISPVSPYEMSRHTNISVNKAMPSELLKLVVGHSESMDTLSQYGHSLTGELEAESKIASKLMENILGK